VLENVMIDSRVSALEQAIRSQSGRLEEADSIAKLLATLLKIIEPAGYTGVASGLLGSESPDALHFANWNKAWLAHYENNRYIFIDPVPLWAIRSGSAIRAGELRAMLPSGHPSREILIAAEPFGYHGGYIVPQRSSDNSFGVVCFVGAGDPETSYECLLLRGLAGVVFERAEIIRMGRRPSIESPVVATLSTRERDCLRLLVRGASARQAARHMKISEPTVRFHIANLHRKLGVKRRSELISVAIARALVRIGDDGGPR
jgi:LuxR family quorum-sensing system transcriptional regulator CciR